MVREEVTGSNQTLEWKCVESRVDSKRLYYGCFILFTLRKDQVDTVGIALQKALLGEIEGTCITHTKCWNVPHEYSTTLGIEESIQKILLNLKEIRHNQWLLSCAWSHVRCPCIDKEVTAVSYWLLVYVKSIG
jgi:DNA-directed RNA polymerase subunit alpha